MGGIGAAIRLPAIVQRITVDDSDLASPQRVQRIQSLGRALTAGVTLPIVGLGVAAVREFGRLDTSLREVTTLTGATGAEADRIYGEMRSQIAGLAEDVGIAQTALTGGLYQALSAGVPQENVFEFMRVASEASVAGVTDVETAVNGISSAVNAFGLESSDAQRVADSMFAAVRGGKTTFGELSEALFNVAPAAAAAGIDLETVNAAIATMTSSGVPTSVATTQIRSAIVALQQPSAELTEIFRDLGYESAQQALEQRGLQFALDAVRDAANGDNGALQNLVGSVEAVSAVNILAGTGADTFARQLENQASAAGSTSAAFEVMEESVGRRFARIRERATTALVGVAEAIAPALEMVLGFVTDLLEGFNNLSPGMQQAIVILLGIAAAVGPIMSVAGSFVRLGSAIASAAAALGPFGVALAAVGAVAAVTFIGHMQESKARVAEFTRLLEEGADAARSMAAEVVVGFSEHLPLDEWGVSIDTVTAAIEGDRAALDELIATMREHNAGPIGGAFVDLIAKEAEELDAAEEALRLKAEADRLVTGTTGEAADSFNRAAREAAALEAGMRTSRAAVDEQTSAMGRVQAGTDEARAALVAYVEEQRAANDPVYAAQRAFDDLAAAKASYNQALSEGTEAEQAEALDRLTEAGRTLYGALGPLETAYGSQEEALAAVRGESERLAQLGLIPHEAVVAAGDNLDALYVLLEGAREQASRAGYDTGVGLVAGVAQGIRDYTAEAVAAAERMVGHVLTETQRAAIIGSPSRLFAVEVGAPIAEGVAEGIAAGARLPAAAMDGVLDRIGDEGRTSVDATAIAATSSRTVTVTGPLLVVEGDVTRDVMPDLERFGDELIGELVTELQRA